MYSAQAINNKITLPVLQDYKKRGEKFVCLTAYDYSFAHLMEQCGVEVVLVGDSLGMVIQGQSTTLPVTMDDMLYHSRAVSKGLNHSLLMVDMPFGSLNSTQQTLDNASQIFKQSDAQVVKLEGGDAQLKHIEILAQYNIPSCAHLGLQPQNVHKMGGYKVQGKQDEDAKHMLDQALAVQSAGTDLLLLECVPKDLAAEITQSLDIPVIGIGAGVDCDAQVLVMHDMLGIKHGGSNPKFVQNFMQGCDSIEQAIKAYVEAVKNKTFPSLEHSFK